MTGAKLAELSTSHANPVARFLLRRATRMARWHESCLTRRANGVVRLQRILYCEALRKGRSLQFGPKTMKILNYPSSGSYQNLTFSRNRSGQYVRGRAI